MEHLVIIFYSNCSFLFFMFSDPESDNSDSSDSDFEPEKEVYLLLSEILLVKAKKFV